ncbi:cytochrome C biogenesis protein [bacterium]|nr:MAG: cytochrome C biogenesis protein [bacterium]
MLEEIFNTLTLALTGSTGLALAAAFAWGVASILLSPCHLSSIPLVIGYLSTQEDRTVRRTFLLALLFAVGILVTVGILGAVTAAMGRLLGDIGFWGTLLVAAVFFVMGLALLDVVHFSWALPAGDSMRGRGFLGALVLGLLFGVGLGPCTFAFLAPILGLVFGTAAANPHVAVLLLAAFALGHCGVIVLAGSLAHIVSRYLAWTSASRGARWLRKGAGVLVILAGVYNAASIF